MYGGAGRIQIMMIAVNPDLYCKIQRFLYIFRKDKVCNHEYFFLTPSGQNLLLFMGLL